ncbi:MAG: amino acid adenylation domain-containing protein, partial [Parasporobacterium sp.]|nr:amino acid adenylation domain-containing protein [Parasporobacterium sp.]
VPVLLDMLTLEAQADGYSFDSLRYAFQSGDWIGLDLPLRLNKVAKNARFISMGGATEAAIWSNYQEVTLPLDPTWKSIPYGHPLPNQKYRVVDIKGQDCPNYVEGELLIGGAGVAKGYINEEKLTNEKFITYQNEKWYKTGDYGKFWNDGTIEFLGRKDFQVKVRGHRIELEEIENNIRKNPSVEKTAVIPINRAEGGKYLAAFIVAADKVLSDSKDKLKEYESIMADYESNIMNKPEFDINISQKYKKHFEFICRKLIEQTKKNLLSGNNTVSDTYTELVKTWDKLLENLSKTDEETISNKKLDYFIEQFELYAGKILSGEMKVYEFMDKAKLASMEEIADLMPTSREKNELVYNIVLAEAKKHKNVKIWEIGGGRPEYGLRLIKELEGVDVKYTITDSNESHLSKARKVFENTSVDVHVENISDKCIKCVGEENKYDIIIAADSLHRENTENALMHISNSLKDKGLFVMAEKTGKEPLAYVTAALLAGEKFSLYDKDKWFELLNKAGLDFVCNETGVLSRHEQGVFVSCPKKTKWNVDIADLKLYLSDVLPEYMVPHIFVQVAQMPVTANGKLDRKSLISLVRDDDFEYKKTLPTDEFTLRLAKIWKEKLNCKEVYLEDDFYGLGGDSLLATQISVEIKKRLHIQLSLEEIFSNPIFGDLATLANLKRENLIDVDIDGTLPAIINKEDIYKPFPMTDVQQSYWLGRNSAYELSDVGVHCYFEMDCPHLDVDLLEDTWNKLINRHDMMRAVMCDDGKNQLILKNVNRYEIDCISLKEDDEEGLLNIRKSMSSKVFDVKKWPLFEIKASNIGKDKTRLHLSFDNIVFDGFSIFRLFNEWKLLYENTNRKLASINGSFRDYCLAVEKLKNTKIYEEQLKFWEERVVNMPPAPGLPLKRDNDNNNQSFTRFEIHLSGEEKQRIFSFTKKYRLTNTIVFLTAYAIVLGRYSKSQHFTLNLTRFQKLPLFEGVENIIGDFTTLTLLEVDLRKGKNFVEHCRNIQKQLLEDMNNSLVSGVVVERLWQKARGGKGVSMPIVFTGGFGVNTKENGAGESLGKIVYGESQTSQVWIDHQVSEQDGQLFLSWDAVCSLFEDGFVENMFESYKELVYALTSASAWETKESLIESSEVKEIYKKTRSERAITGESLISLYEKSVKAHKDKPALENSTGIITYEELDEKVSIIAAKLVREGVKKGDIVGIMTQKSFEQIYAALAVMKAGAAYMPIDIENPLTRIESIIKQSRAAYILHDANVSDHVLKSLKDVNLYKIEEILEKQEYEEATYPQVEDGDMAYIIFTSGSTGKPKGVMINHRGAVNTIVDVNDKFGVNSADSTIFISNFNFDLSVYDVFGMLSVGGKVVVLDDDKRKEPSHWITMVRKCGVTIWNSVPAFLTILADYKSDSIQELKNTLRLILMSGDWIPVSLPDRLKAIFKGVSVVSLGGATECSIWSNYYVIEDKVSPDARSIPYGVPLSNQQFYVLNEMGRECPVWVPGELYISGEGLAMGYCNDEEKTDSSFVHNHISGKGKMYKTGDMGRFLPDGNIEFLGREDSQIKKNGHRIECGEIENQIAAIKGVAGAVVTASKKPTVSVSLHMILDKDSSLLNLSEAEDIYEETDVFEQLKGIQDFISEEKVKRFNKAVDETSILAILLDLKALNLDLNENSQTLNNIGLSKVGIKIIEMYYKSLKNHLDKTCTNLEEAIKDYEKHLADYEYDEIKNLSARLDASRSIRLDLLKGIIDSKDIMLKFKDEFPMPDSLKNYDITNDIMRKETKLLFETYAKAYENKAPKVLEIASRANDDTADLWDAFSKIDGKITYADESAYYLDEKKKKFEDAIDYMRFSLDNPDPHIKGGAKYDIILADNTLHRVKDLNVAIKNIKNMLKAGGTLVIRENLETVPLMMLTTTYLEEGYGKFKDERAKDNMPLLSKDKWKRLLKQNGFLYVLGNLIANKDVQGGRQIMLFQKDTLEESINYDMLDRKIKEAVPEYMIPDNIFVYDEFPLSANGKVDRKALGEIALASFKESRKEIKQPKTQKEKIILEIWKDVMNNQNIGTDDNFFSCGGDSLKAIVFINTLKEKGIDISLQELFENPTVEKLAVISENKKSKETTVTIEEGEL